MQLQPTEQADAQLAELSQPAEHAEAQPALGPHTSAEEQQAAHAHELAGFAGPAEQVS